MRQFRDLFGCSGDHSASSHKNEGLFCGFDHLGRRVHVFLSDLAGFSVNSGRTAGRVFILRACHVLCHVYQNRTGTAAFCYIKGFADSVRKLGDILDNIAVFRYRHYDSGNVHFLERILSEKSLSYVCRDRHYRNGVHISCCDSCYQIRSPRAGGSHADAYLSGGPGISVRRMGSALLMGGQNVGDLIPVFIKSVIYVQDRAARIPENGVHSLLFQTFYNDFCTCKLHPVPSLFCFWYFQNSSSVA